MDVLAWFLVYYQVLAFALIPFAVLVVLLPSAEKRWSRGCGVVNLAVALTLLLCVANALRGDIAAHKYAVASLPRSVPKLFMTLIPAFSAVLLAARGAEMMSGRRAGRTLRHDA